MPMRHRRNEQATIGNRQLDSSHRRNPAFVVLALSVLVFVGCGDAPNPIESRLDDMGYTPELLARELEQRLPLATSSRRQTRDSGRASKWVAMEDRDRGVDVRRPNPNTFEAIIDDVAHKIMQLRQGSGAAENVLAEVLSELDTSDKLRDTVKEKTKRALEGRIDELVESNG